MKIVKISYNCNIILTISTIVLFLYVFFYKPKLTLKSKEVLLNL